MCLVSNATISTFSYVYVVSSMYPDSSSSTSDYGPHFAQSLFFTSFTSLILSLDKACCFINRLG